MPALPVFHHPDQGCFLHSVWRNFPLYQVPQPHVLKQFYFLVHKEGTIQHILHYILQSITSARHCILIYGFSPFFSSFQISEFYVSAHEQCTIIIWGLLILSNSYVIIPCQEQGILYFKQDFPDDSHVGRVYAIHSLRNTNPEQKIFFLSLPLEL